jgi:hypothetical protein
MTNGMIQSYYPISTNLVLPSTSLLSSTISARLRIRFQHRYGLFTCTEKKNTSYGYPCCEKPLWPLPPIIFLANNCLKNHHCSSTTSSSKYLFIYCFWHCWKRELSPVWRMGPAIIQRARQDRSGSVTETRLLVKHTRSELSWIYWHHCSLVTPKHRTEYPMWSKTKPILTTPSLFKDLVSESALAVSHLFNALQNHFPRYIHPLRCWHWHCVCQCSPWVQWYVCCTWVEMSRALYFLLRSW